MNVFRYRNEPDVYELLLLLHKPRQRTGNDCTLLMLPGGE
jgi:hypothetical protein